MGDQQPAVAPDGSVYSNMFNAIGVGIFLGKFDSSGNPLWHIFDQFVQSTNVLSSPDVGLDGRIYDGRNLASLYAINGNGTVQWQYSGQRHLVWSRRESTQRRATDWWNRHLRPARIL